MEPPCERRLRGGPKPLDLVKERLDGGRLEPIAFGSQITLADGDEVAWRAARLDREKSIEPGVRQEPADIVEDHRAVLVLGRHPVHDDEQRKPTFLDSRQDGPRDLVRVARRRRHEAAQVGCLDEPIGERPVRVLEGVDVGRVDERHALLERVVLHEPQLVAIDARERAVDEGRTVIRVDEDDGDTSRRPEDAGLARRTAGERIEDRALAGSGRPDEQDDERRVERCRADADVPTQMVGELTRPGEGRVGPGARGKTPCREVVESVDEHTKLDRFRSDHEPTLVGPSGTRDDTGPLLGATGVARERPAPGINGAGPDGTGSVCAFLRQGVGFDPAWSGGGIPAAGREPADRLRIGGISRSEAASW